MTAFTPGRRPSPQGQRPTKMMAHAPKPRRLNPGECTVGKVQDVCQKAGFALTTDQAEQMTEYLRLLMQWNAVMNLVGKRDWLDTLENLAMDSLWLKRFLDEQVCPAITMPDSQKQEVWDLGAGAGLPGIPLRIVWQQSQATYHLVEAREKRALFLSTVLTRLSLPNTQVFRGRAEQFMEGRKASLILSRAFMPWREVLKLVREYVVPGGRVVLLSLEPLATQQPVSETTDALGIPDGWMAAEQMRYQTVGGTRYFCSFTPINAPS